MKQIVKVLVVMLMTIAVFCVVHATSTEAASSKIYSEYKLPDAKSKFPMQLSNGLTVTTMEVNSRTLPTVKKGSETVWTGTSRTKVSYVRFTVTKNGDTYLYYKTSVGVVDTVDLVGINKNGKVFLNKPIKGKNNKIYVDFIGPSMVEIIINQNLNNNIKSDGTYYFPEDHYSNFYQLYTNGGMKELAYIDKAFIDQAKKGQLKWTLGALGMTYKDVQVSTAALNGRADNVVGSFNTWKAAYLFNSTNNKTIKPNETVWTFFRYNQIVAKRKEVGPLLRQYLGKPVSNYENAIMIYKAGKYYLMVYYAENGRAEVTLMTKEKYKYVKDLF